MENSIEYLKTVVLDQSELRYPTGSIFISRLSNNVLRINGKLISWKNLRELLISGSYELIVKDEKKIKLNGGPGGCRIPGPGKTLGRNKINPEEKKKTVSFTLSNLAVEKIGILAKSYEVSKSKMIEELIFKACP